jgi:hypothetical protein
MSERLHVKCQLFLTDFSENLNFLRQLFGKSLNIKFQENTSSGSRVVPCGRTDMTKLIVAFRNSTNAPKNSTVPFAFTHIYLLLLLLLLLSLFLFYWLFTAHLRVLASSFLWFRDLTQ